MHVFSNKTFFDTLHKKDGGSLFLGDRTPSKIQDFGNVNIKMFDEAVHTLGDVAYVSKL